MTITSTAFDIKISDHGLGRNLPQRIGRVLWGPMWLMAIMAFPVAFIVSLVRANALAGGGAETTVAALGHVVSGVMFLGFAAVFAAISFAIARILGEFRKGGGEVQETTGRKVHSLKMPTTAKLFIALMILAMMTLVVAVILHFVAAAAIAGGSSAALASAERWAVWLEGVRRIGIALYLLSITLGLATIVEVLRFQAVRIRELPEEPAFS